MTMLLEVNYSNSAISAAKGISEFGFLAITSAFYLVITGIIIIFFVKWFVKIIDNIVKGQEKTLGEIISLQRSMVTMVKSINDGINDETLAQVKAYSEAVFENAKHRVFFEIKKIKTENHIEGNEDYVRKKIRGILENLHSSRNQRFDVFSYRGKKLSEYTNPLWIDKIEDIFFNSIYDENYNKQNIFSNLTIAYTHIMNEFYINLIKN